MKAPRGFLLSGVRSGIRRKRPDLALVLAKDGASAAAVFTKNRFQAAPVVLSRRALARSSGRVSAVVVNAGCANAITGRAGLDAARRVRARAAQLLHLREEEIFLASTGVIGVLLPEAKIHRALPEAVARLSPMGLDAASHAILTTDIAPKTARASFRLGGRRGSVVGFAKGAGMIHPDMATMLGFVMTDAAATPAFLRAALKEAVGASFNAISVDGDTSTNDTVLLLASGKMGGPVLDVPSAGRRLSSLETDEKSAGFRRALGEVCGALARMIVRDGEGATRLLLLEVRGARTERDARLAAYAAATSTLVKTALAGGDPNWGRILAAVGRSGARFSASRISLEVGGLSLVRAGRPVDYRERDAARLFSREEVPVVVDLGAGRASASVITCDLGHDYVSLNADYRS